MNCCDEYGDCNQGRNCPVRVAKVGRKDYDREALPPSPAPRYLKHLAKWLLIVLAVVLVSCSWLILIASAAGFAPSKQTIDCSLESFSPDFTPAMREACRKRKATP